MFAQTSLEFIFNENQITISNSEVITENILVFKGEIPEDQLPVTTSILGKIVKKEKEIHFIPIVPFGWNQKYTVLYNHTITHFSLPVPENYEFLSVSKIYPTSSRLPSNLLKWYIRFSKPINTAHIYDHIKFVNASGDTLSRVVLRLENALISDNATLLTLWIEPGRQKRDLIPNKQLGPVFNNQENYSLIISKNIKDNKGVSMQKDFIHPFLITDTDRVKLAINTWEINSIEANSRGNLLIKCDEPIDYGSSLNNITILNSNDQEVTGTWDLLNQEKVIAFKPKEPWKKDSYEVHFDAGIEDLAGNNLYRLFDNELHTISDKEIPIESYKLEFIIK